MKLIRIKQYTLLLILISIFACESDLDLVKAPAYKQKLVITAFISPADKISYFRVTTNKKLFGELNTEEPLGLLSGFISDGTDEVALDTCSIGLMLNHEKMQIRYGRTYKLRVSTEKGISAEAECKVPFKREFNIEADTFSVLRDYSDYPYLRPPNPGITSFRTLGFSLTFSDIAGENNYYRTFGKLKGYYWHNNPANKGTLTDYLTFNQEFFSDEGTEGKSLSMSTLSNNNHFFDMNFDINIDSLFVKIYLLNTEKSYYQYHKSMQDYVDGNNPFSEPTPIYSNINGGFGVFTSYTIDSLFLRLK